MIQTPFRLSPLNVVWVPGWVEKGEGLYGFYVLWTWQGDKTVPACGSSLGSSHRDVLALMMFRTQFPRLLGMTWSLWLAWSHGSPAYLYQYQCGFYHLKTFQCSPDPSTPDWHFLCSPCVCPWDGGPLIRQLALKSVFTPMGNAISQPFRWCAPISPSGFYLQMFIFKEASDITTPGHFLCSFLLSIHCNLTHIMFYLFFIEGVSFSH